MAPPGLSALGAKGSVRDRLTPPGRVEGSALGSYIVSLRWRGTAPSAPSYMSMPPAALRSGGRRLAVRKTIEYQIGALPRTPFPAAREFPSRGNERYEGKNSESYTSRTIPVFSPFGGWRHHLARWEACHWIRGSRGSPMNPVPLPPPQAGALWMLSLGAMSLQESIERPILPPEQGWQGNTIRKEAKRPENRVTRFPVEKSGEAG